MIFILKKKQRVDFFFPMFYLRHIFYSQKKQQVDFFFPMFYFQEVVHVCDQTKRHSVARFVAPRCVENHQMPKEYM